MIVSSPLAASGSLPESASTGHTGSTSSTVTAASDDPRNTSHLKQSAMDLLSASSLDARASADDEVNAKDLSFLTLPEIFHPISHIVRIRLFPL